MPPEDNTPPDSGPERTSGYEYSTSDSAARSDSSADSTPLKKQKPLGLQRSDRSGQRRSVGGGSVSSSATSSSASDDSASSASASSGSESGGSVRSRAVGGNTGSSSTGRDSLGGSASSRISGGASMGTASMGTASIGAASSRTSGAQADVAQLVRQGVRELEVRKQALQREIAQLEQRKERLDAEMKSSFAGASQDVAIRVQSFKNYLVGSLEDLATLAQEMDLVPSAPAPQRSREEAYSRNVPARNVSERAVPQPQADASPLAAQRFAQQRDRINSLLDQYRTRPDYYGPPWQLRRTFEPVHADRASNWFFTQGGRGAVKSMGSRLQNVLVASATISCMHAIYDRRLCVLVLATTPERIGEWRRWLQDCLGISRVDFGADRGVMIFDDATPMSQRAERLMDSGRIPFLIMDEAEEKVSLSLLQYPLWLGFAPDPANPSADYDYY